MKVYSYFLGGSRKIPDLKEIAKTESLNEEVIILIIQNVEVALNKYGIQTEYSGRVHVNINVVIQSKYVSEIEKKMIREKAAKETFKIFSHINQHIHDENEMRNETEEKINDLMNTKYFGAINRHEGN
jgi:hypothetical protein